MAEFTEGDRTGIREAAQASVVAMNSRDFAGFSDSIHADDVTMMPPGSPPLYGRASVTEFLQAFPPFKNMNFELLEIEGDGDLAYVRGKYSMDLVDEAGGVVASDVGSYLEVWRRDSAGWRVVQDIFNTDLS